MGLSDLTGGLSTSGGIWHLEDQAEVDSRFQVGLETVNTSRGAAVG